MPLPKRYKPSDIEPELIEKWQRAGTYHFQSGSTAPVYSLDTPPATVSGKLHLGHTYSYSHPDFIARFWRMNGHNVFYPMGFDDNGLPTGRLVEKQLGLRAAQLGRKEFVEKCLQVSESYGREYKELWQRLGLSVDWRYTYRTISPESRRISQLSFIELFKGGFAYRKKSPTIWCPECQTAIAQAEMEDLNHDTEFVTLNFPLHQTESTGTAPSQPIQIATTRPELLPACVAVFVHPQDERYTAFVGQTARVPIFHQQVPILADPLADPHKGTGAVMCCTFGDQTDVAWWRLHRLPLLEAIDRTGRMTVAAKEFQFLPLHQARKAIIKALQERGFLVSVRPVNHEIRVHERCQTPVEYLTTRQWFIRVLDYKDQLLQAGRQIHWVPSHMRARYESWVDNLNWDWCISRQRYYGVPFPIWYCQDCDTILLPQDEQLPLDPLETSPKNPCHVCGSLRFHPDSDVMDTWATSSLTPEIVGGWLDDPDLYGQVAPFSLRPQAHEIIRTWTFYTILKSKLHFDTLPWENILISGWGIAGEGMGKISKSRGRGPVPPLEMIQAYSADAVRYWAASTAPGKDSVISEDKIKNGAKLVTKLWNIARFSAPFIDGFQPDGIPTGLTAADKWALSRLHNLIKQATASYQTYDYAAAKTETETYLWTYADNYIEMAKQRLYNPSQLRLGALFTLHQVLLNLLKLLAPILPFVTERIFQGLFAADPYEACTPLKESIHTSPWPQPHPALISAQAERVGDLLVEIASQVRRFKSENAFPLNTPLKRLQLCPVDFALTESVKDGIPDLSSITRAEEIEITQIPEPSLEMLIHNDIIKVAIDP